MINVRVQFDVKFDPKSRNSRGKMELSRLGLKVSSACFRNVSRLVTLWVGRAFESARGPNPEVEDVSQNVVKN